MEIPSLPSSFNRYSLLALTLGGGILLSPLIAQARRSWTEVPAPKTETVNFVYDLAVLTDDDVWAVGTAKSDKDTTLAEHWDGTSWSVVPSPNLSQHLNILAGVSAITPGNIWAVGAAVHDRMLQPISMHWNGQQWTVVAVSAVPGDASLNAVSAVASDDVWAVGYDLDGPMTMHWDGHSWSVVPVPPAGAGAFTSVRAIASNDVWAVGSQQNATQTLTLAMHWDGAAWNISPVPSPTGLDFLNSVTASGRNDVWTVGFSGTRGIDQTALILHWNGAVWTKLGPPLIDSSTELRDVAALSVTNAVVVGDNAAGPLTAHWDGAGWRIFRSPPPDNGQGYLQAIDVGRDRDHPFWAAGQQGTANATQLFLEMSR